LTRRFIERARASHFTALVLTVDTKVQGPRERDMRNGFTVPPRFSAATIVDFAWHYSWLFDVGLGPRITFKNFIGSKGASTDAMTITQFIAGQYDLSVGWRDVEWFKSAWGGPVLLKGILTAEDARLALDRCRRRNRFESWRTAAGRRDARRAGPARNRGGRGRQAGGDT